MITYTGRNVWPARTAPPGIDLTVGPSIEDIAVGLSRQSRFAGQTRRFYSVLCHSVIGALAVDQFDPSNQQLRRWLLLHDAHESVLSDVPTTWGNEILDEDKADLDERIAREHGLENHATHLLDIKRYDRALLASEAHALGHLEAEKWWPRSGWTDMEEFMHEATLLSIRDADSTTLLTRPGLAIELLQTELDKS